MLKFEYDRDLTDLSPEGLAWDLSDGPEMTHYEGRIGHVHRLMMAWGSAETTVRLLSEGYQSDWRGAIVALHDYKGVLNITWRDHQSRMMFEGIIVGAWRRAGEHEHAHTLVGQG